MTEKISVLIPTYNREKYIERSLMSVLEQSYKELDILIYDDGSTDNTVAIIKKLMHADPRIRLIEGKINKGVAFARNKLIENCNTHYACWHDSDDYSNKYRIYYQTRSLEKNPNALIFGNWKKVLSNNENIWRKGPEGLRNVTDGFATLMFPVDKTIKFENSMVMGGEDWTWVKQMKIKYPKVIKLPICLYYIRFHEDRIGYWKRKIRFGETKVSDDLLTTMSYGELIKYYQNPDVLRVKTCISNQNFGDKILNTNLVAWMSNQKVKLVNNKDTSPSYLMAGSILGWADKTSTVWGSGFLSASTRLKEAPKKICAVRGELSKYILSKQGIECPEIFGDPGLLYPRFYNPSIKKKYKLGIIPHYVDAKSAYLKNFAHPDIKIINIIGEGNRFINEILECEKIASSSLHGMIIADAYNVPSIWIELSNKLLGGGFKFRDYFSSVKREDVLPLIINENSQLKDLYAKFTNYKIDINLDLLFDAYPIKKGV